VETTSKMGADVFAATVKTTLSHIKNKKAVPVLFLNVPDFLKNPCKIPVKIKKGFS